MGDVTASTNEKKFLVPEDRVLIKSCSALVGPERVKDQKRAENKDKARLLNFKTRSRSSSRSKRASVLGDDKKEADQPIGRAPSVEMLDVGGVEDNSTPTNSKASSLEDLTSASQRKRIKDRSYTTGEYVGVWKAKQKLRELETQAEIKQACRELEDDWGGRRTTQSMLIGNGIQSEERRREIANMPAHELQAQVEVSAKELHRIARFKSNKGTTIKVLKDVARIVSGVAPELSNRSRDDEVRRLEENNAFLSRDVSHLRKEIAGMRRELASLKRRKVNSPHFSEAEQSPQSSPRRGFLASPSSKKMKRGNDGNNRVPLPSSGDILTQSILRQVGDILEVRFQPLRGACCPRGVSDRNWVLAGRIPPSLLLPLLREMKGMEERQRINLSSRSFNGSLLFFHH